MRISGMVAAGLVVCCLIGAGCSNNNKAEVPYNAAPPPTLKPGFGVSPAPVAPQSLH